MSTKKDKFSIKDKNYMKLAINLARARKGLTGENPSVGCLIVKDDKIISIGQTGYNGRPHAESNAINNSFQNLEGAKMYVTLEPCNHYGKTPPCTNLIKNKKIKKVVYGINDVDKRTSKKAKKFFKKNNIEVINGILSKKINKFYKSYFYIKEKKLPYVVGKIASSKDGFIKSKKYRFITNSDSQNISHLLRYRCHGILISHKTLNSDNPKLNCRLNGLEKYSPARIILDKNLEFKKNSYLIKKAKKIPTYIFYSKENAEKINFLKKKGIKIFKLNLKNNYFQPADIYKKLYRSNIFYLIVEGGLNLTSNFMKHNAFNEFFHFKSNKKLKKNGTIKLRNLDKILKNKFNNSEKLNSFTENDQVLRYY